MKIGFFRLSALCAAVALTAGAALLTGCKSSRKAVVAESALSQSAPVVASSAEIPADAAALINASRSRADGWQTLRLPVSVSLSAPASLSASATLEMVNGRTIDLSVKLLGFEVASGHIESDTVTVIVKPARSYVRESISHMLGGAAVSVADLQAMLLGAVVDPTPLVARGVQVTAAAEPDGTRFLALMTADMNLGLGFRFPAGRDLLDLMTVASAKGFQGEIDFADYTAVKGGNGLEMPGLISFNGEQMARGRKVAGQIKANVGRAKLNDRINSKPVNIPADYRKVDLSSLLKSF